MDISLIVMLSAGQDLKLYCGYTEHTYYPGLLYRIVWQKDGRNINITEGPVNLRFV